MLLLSKGFGNCLTNRPKRNYLEKEKSQVTRFAGEFFDADAQCSLVFGRGSRVCSYMPSCRRLWCTTPEGEQNGCKTQHMPWADGTQCGEGKWCVRSQCVKRNVAGVKPVHGGWGDWQRYVLHVVHQYMYYNTTCST